MPRELTQGLCGTGLPAAGRLQPVRFADVKRPHVSPAHVAGRDVSYKSEWRRHVRVARRWEHAAMLVSNAYANRNYWTAAGWED